MDALGERSEIADALKFVVRKLDLEVVLDPREQVERLQAVDTELFKKIVVGSKLLSRDFEMFSCESQYFVGCAL
jgi:hypothetical protein